MALKVRWSVRADKTFAKVVNYLQNEWTDKEVQAFIRKSNKIAELISQSPEMFPVAKKNNIRKVVVTKQNSMLYRISKKKIELLYFWDNRQDPKKNKH